MEYRNRMIDRRARSVRAALERGEEPKKFVLANMDAEQKRGAARKAVGIRPSVPAKSTRG